MNIIIAGVTMLYYIDTDMSRLGLLVQQVNEDSYKKEWKDKLEEKLSGAGYNFDNDRPSIESFINFGADIL